MRELLRVTWTVTPLRPPVAWRHCSRCGETRRFRTSGKFRVNSQKKLIDVWLIYRCEVCEASWNLPILERATVREISHSDFAGFTQNDPALARRYAFDMARLRRHAARLEGSPEFIVSKTHASGCRSDPGAIEVTLSLSDPCESRLDMLLAREFGLSRGSIARLADRELLTVLPMARKGVRAMLADGQVIRLALERTDGKMAAALIRAALEAAFRASP